MPDALPTWDQAFGTSPPPPASPSQPVPSGPDVDAAVAKSPMAPILDAFGEGPQNNWGSNFTLSDEATQILKAAGVHSDITDQQEGFGKSFNEAQIRPAAGQALTNAQPALPTWDAAFADSKKSALDRASEWLSANPSLGLGDVLARANDQAPGPEGNAAHTIGRIGLAISTYATEMGTSFAKGAIDLLRGTKTGDLSPEAVQTFTTALGTGILKGGLPAPTLSPLETQLAESRSLGVIGEGEAGWKGTVEPTPEQVAARIAAAGKVAPTEQAPTAAAAPDIHALAREAAPEVFGGQEGFDALTARRDLFRGWLDELGQNREALPEAQALKTQVDDILAKVGGVEDRLTSAQADRLADARSRLNDFLIADTPDMAMLRRTIQATDYKMRDLAPQVSSAYREAQARMPVAEMPIAETAPEATPEAAPAVAPQTEPQPEAAAAQQTPQTPEQTAPVPGGIAERVAKQLTDAGRPADEAQAAAALVEAHYNARAERFGGALGSGVDLFERDAPQIKAGRQTAKQLELAQTGEAPAKAARGKITLKNAQSTITLFKNANASTFIHETGHQWLEELMRDAASSRAPTELRGDAASVRRWLGAEDGAEIKRVQHEKFARGFEHYMMEGTAPTRALATVFAKFKNWLTQIYQTVAKLRSPITDDIRDVFDRLLTNNPERTVVAPERETPKNFADVHEAQAEAATPQEAGDLADAMRPEIDRIAKEEVPDVHAELNPGGEAGPIQGENRNAPDRTDAAEPVAPEAGNAAQPGTVAAGGNPAPSKGIGGESAQRAKSRVDLADPNAPLPPAESRLVDKAGNIRLDNIETPEDFKQAIRDAAERNGDFLARRQGIVTDAQRDALASAMGTTPDKVLGKQIGETFSDSEIKMLEKTLAESSMKVHGLAVKAATGTDADVVALTEAYLRHDMIQGAYSQATAEAGRAFRALRKSQEFWSKESLATNEIIKQGIGDATGRTLFQMQNIAKKIANLGTPGQVSKFVRASQRSGLFDWIQSVFVNALISGPLTHAGYTAAGEMFGLFRAVGETGASALVGKVRETFGLGEAEYARAGEIPHQLYGMMRGGRNGIKAAWQAIKSNQVVLPAEVQQHRAGTTGQAINPRETIPNPTVGGVKIPIGTVLESPGRLIAALHSFNWTTFYSQSIAGQAFRQAMLEKLDGQPFANRVASLTQAPTDAMIEQGSADANGGALMQRPAYDSLMGTVSRLTNWGVKVPDLPLPSGASLPMGTLRPLKYIDPFVQIQANIQKAAFGRGTPLALFSQVVRDDLSMKSGGVAFDRTAGRILAGTSFMIAAGGLAAEGLLNHSGPTTPAEAREWQRINGQPHGLTIGNLSYDVLRLGNLGLQMSVAADLYHTASMVGKEDLSKVSADLVHAFAQNIVDESSMRGPAEILRAVDDSDRYGAAWVRNFLSSAIPFSVLLSQVARQFDPYSRDARTTMDAIRAKIPFVSEELQPRYDVWGQPVANRGWAATSTQQIIDDPVDKALYGMGIYPSLPERRIRGVPLTDQQYADYSRVAGRLAYMRLKPVVMAPTFPTIPPQGQHDLIEKIISGSREQARSQIMMQSIGTPDDIVRKATDAKKAQFQRAAP